MSNPASPVLSPINTSNISSASHLPSPEIFPIRGSHNASLMVPDMLPMLAQVGESQWAPGDMITSQDLIYRQPHRQERDFWTWWSTHQQAKLTTQLNQHDLLNKANRIRSSSLCPRSNDRQVSPKEHRLDAPEIWGPRNASMKESPRVTKPQPRRRRGTSMIIAKPQKIAQIDRQSLRYARQSLRLKIAEMPKSPSGYIRVSEQTAPRPPAQKPQSQTARPHYRCTGPSMLLSVSNCYVAKRTTGGNLLALP